MSHEKSSGATLPNIPSGFPRGPEIKTLCLDIWPLDILLFRPWFKICIWICSECMPQELFAFIVRLYDSFIRYDSH